MSDEDIRKSRDEYQRRFIELRKENSELRKQILLMEDIKNENIKLISSLAKMSSLSEQRFKESENFFNKYREADDLLVKLSKQLDKYFEIRNKRYPK